MHSRSAGSVLYRDDSGRKVGVELGGRECGEGERMWVGNLGQGVARDGVEGKRTPCAGGMESRERQPSDGRINNTEFR